MGAHAREVALDCRAETQVCGSHDSGCVDQRVRAALARIAFCNRAEVRGGAWRAKGGTFVLARDAFVPGLGARA
jgi:hypothetical protein